MPGKIPLDQILQQSPIPGQTTEVVPAGNTNIFQRALAEILGLPVDLTNSAITGVLKAVGLPEYVIEDPVGGRAWLMDNTGITTDDLQAAVTGNFAAVMDAKSRFMERIKQGYSDMLIPDEEIASKELNKGHFGSGWLPDFAENASIMWNRELMRASKTSYTNTKVAPILIDLQTAGFKKAVNVVPEEKTSNLLDFFIQPAHAPTDVWSDAYAEYDLANLPYIDEDASLPRTIQDAQAINSVYYWDGEGEKHIALYKEQLDHFKSTSSYSPVHDDSALTQAANWMESAAITGMQINFDEIGGSTTTQVTNAWDNFKSAKTLDEATAALSFVSEVSTAQPSLDFQFDDIVDPHKYTTAGDRYTGLAPVYEERTTQEWVDSQNIVASFPDTNEGLEQATALQRDLQSQGKWASVMSPMKETDGLYTVIDNSATPTEKLNQTALDSVVSAGSYPSGLPSVNELQENISDQAVLPAETVVSEEDDEQSLWSDFKDLLFNSADPTKLGESAYADTMIRDQMAEEARKQTALMGTGPTQNIGNLPLSTWGDTPFNMDAVDPAMINQQILDELTTPVQLEGWRDTYPSQDDTWEMDLYPPADTTDLGGSLTAGPQENIFVGLESDEQDALMTDNKLMDDYLKVREKIKPYQYPEYAIPSSRTEHEDYYPGSRAAANAAGFNFLGATKFNPAFANRQDDLRMIMGVPLGQTYTSDDWIGAFGPRGIANAADINARIGMLQDEFFSSDDPASGGTSGVSVGSVGPGGIGEPPSGS
jgi:hypothetical protein|tara:strand:+ start:166 stop:2463 length:2298 start_codon:yes stop_codon:yes gene_type:complete